MTTEEIKRKIGIQAADLVEDGMTIGLGTGTTAFHMIQRLIQRCNQGLKIKAVASSKASEKLAREGGIPILDINTLSSLDLTIDGADEIDSVKRMIKGGGGALVREKIVASMSQEMIVIVDESKLCQNLGNKKLPVEVIPFGTTSVLNKLDTLGYKGDWRKTKEGALYVTDNGNYIIDIVFSSLLKAPELDEEKILAIPGVVDTGFFFNLAGRVVIGFFDGQIVIQS
jgi:ribose 5-phosphate isomerase A